MVEFYACSNFPDCRQPTPAIVKEIGVECPKCHPGQIIERKTKRNPVLFMVAIAIQICDSLTSWDKPVGRSCPECGQYLVKKSSRWWQSQLSGTDMEITKRKKSKIINVLHNFNLCKIISKSTKEII